MKINVFKMQILMGEKGLTIKKLAELSGVSRQTISCIISGKSCTPQVAYKIATALDQELSQIVKEEVEYGLKIICRIAAIYGKKCADYGNCKSNRKRCSLRSYRNTAGNFEIWSGNEDG